MKNKAIDYKTFIKVIESSNLNFLIGSGASMPFLKTLKDIEVALEHIEKREGLEDGQNDEDVIQMIELAVKKYYFEKCLKNNLDLIGRRDGNETFLDYKSILQSIHTIISQRSTSIISKQVNLFTTNVDVLLDLALEELGYSYNDGFAGRANPTFGTENYHNIIHKVSSYYEYQFPLPLFNLFKLHGSLNWKFNKEKDCIEFDGNLSSSKKASGLINDITFPVNCFDEDGNFDNLEELYSSFRDFKERLKEKKEFETYQEKLNELKKSYDEIIMVNPRKEKFEETTLKLSYYELLRMYSNNLEKESSTLFVIGFSFADEHIRNLTLRVAKSNPTLLIIIFAHSNQAQKDIEAKLGVHPNIRYAVREDHFTLREVDKSFFKKLSEELILPTDEDEKKSNQDEMNTKKESDEE